MSRTILMTEQNDFITIMQFGTINLARTYMIKNKHQYINIPLPLVNTPKSYGIHCVNDKKIIPYLANIGYYNERYGKVEKHGDFMFWLNFDYNHKFVV